MNFTYAKEDNLEELKKRDSHISAKVLLKKIRDEEIILVNDEKGMLVGFLRFNYFWDSIPFMNMLQIVSTARRKGIGKALVTFWESEMKKQGHNYVLTSTQSDEEAQHFYRKIDYKENGSFILPNEPLEIIFGKKL
ncbi:GNAT family N-acetyltransferase [Lottiidibacillus patelloidae]|uniref:GNAT family N-acetyltransferase n=2 Tax=Lottiidibacillus patelloidae TaxID=2670334 RepID=A0A263BUG4_9BACI|nr:GNAT family N-acetyltransferase [Lottiidibacillus patelloidae]